jgi:hypothetical protein
VRDRYDAPYENESLRHFIAGEPDDLSWIQGWLSMVREATAEGRRFARVRVVSLPLTDYSRFGVWCSRLTNSAGEDIRYLDRQRAVAEGLPDEDFWLFDSRRLVRMHFDDSDRFLGGEVVEDPAEIIMCNYWRDVARHHNERRDDFAGRTQRPATRGVVVLAALKGLEAGERQADPQR